MKRLWIAIVIVMLSIGTVSAQEYSLKGGLMGANLGSLAGYLLGDKSTKTALWGGVAGGVIGAFLGPKPSQQTPMNCKQYSSPAGGTVCGPPDFPTHGKPFRMVVWNSQFLNKMPRVNYGGQSFWPAGRHNPWMGRCKVVETIPVFYGDGMSRPMQIRECR